MCVCAAQFPARPGHLFTPPNTHPHTHTHAQNTPALAPAPQSEFFTRAADIVGRREAMFNLLGIGGGVAITVFGLKGAKDANLPITKVRGARPQLYTHYVCVCIESTRRRRFMCVYIVCVCVESARRRRLFCCALVPARRHGTDWAPRPPPPLPPPPRGRRQGPQTSGENGKGGSVASRL